MQEINITLKTVTDYFGSETTSKGKSIHSQGSLFNLIKRKNGLYGKCRGSIGTYNLHCIFKNNQITELDCSCPAMENFGPCKHLTAMLIAWINNANSFQERLDLEAHLSGKSSEDLKKLILKACKEEEDCAEIFLSLLEKTKIKRKKRSYDYEECEQCGDPDCNEEC